MMALIKNQTVILISGALIFALVVSCAGKPKTTQTKPQDELSATRGGTTHDIDVNSKGDEGKELKQNGDKASSDAPDSQATETEGALPEGWPANVPIMDGFAIKRGTSNAQGWKSVLATGTLPIDDVAKFYSDLPGWTKDPNVPWITQGPSRMLKLVNGNENLTVNIIDRDKTIHLTLTYFLSR